MSRISNITLSLAVCDVPNRKGYLHLYIDSNREVVLRFCVDSSITQFCYLWRYHSNADAARRHFDWLYNKFFIKQLDPLPKIPTLDVCKSLSGV